MAPSARSDWNAQGAPVQRAACTTAHAVAAGPASPGPGTCRWSSPETRSFGSSGRRPALADCPPPPQRRPGYGSGGRTSSPAALAAVGSWSLARRATRLVVAPVEEDGITAAQPLARAGDGGIIIFGSSVPANLATQLHPPDAAAPGNFSPVLDAKDGPGPDATHPDGARSFGADPEIATPYGLAFATGPEEAGVVPLVKHFPGLGHAGGNTDGAPAPATVGAAAGRAVVVLVETGTGVLVGELELLDPDPDLGSKSVHSRERKATRPSRTAPWRRHAAQGS